MPLWDEIDEEGSTWFQNDRRATPAGSASPARRRRCAALPAAQSRGAGSSHSRLVPAQGCGDLAEEEQGAMVGRADQGEVAQALHQGARAAPVRARKRRRRSLRQSRREWRPTAAPAPAPQVDFAKWCDEDDKEYTGEDSFPGGG